MPREMLITVVEGEESRIAIVEDGNLEELYLERASVERHVGNIYKGRVNNVEPSIQAAFVDIGMPKNGFLHASDVIPSAWPRRGNKKPAPPDPAPAAAEGTEVAPATPSEAEARRQRYNDGLGGPRKLIQEVLRPGDEVVVQITKEGIGTKGPSLTTALSIPGRYLVLMPGLGRLGVSRKIEDEKTRRELRDLLGSLSPPQDMGFIVRTAGVGRTKGDLKKDLQYLERLWKVVQARVQGSKAPAEIFRESDLVMRTLRDVFTPDITTIWVDNEAVHKRVRDFLKIALPKHVECAKLYTEKVPLFHKYHVEEAIERMYSRTVTLPKGGSLVIDQTEALVAIDVNSGRFRHGRDAEESAHQLNLMAANEIARQVRMRDLGGLIIMDFVDMARAENRRHVEKALRDAFKGDKARQQMLHISKFGIVEMTRQRVQPSLERSTFMDCPYCKGTGILKHPESLALEVMRHLKLLTARDGVALIEVTAHPQLADYINNSKRGSLSDMETGSRRRIRVTSDATAPIDRVTYRCTDDHGAEVRVDLPPPPPVHHEAPAQQQPQPQSQRQPRNRQENRQKEQPKETQPAQQPQQQPQASQPQQQPQPQQPQPSQPPQPQQQQQQQQKKKGRHRRGRRSRGRGRGKGGAPQGPGGEGSAGGSPASAKEQTPPPVQAEPATEDFPHQDTPEE
jgi:ribonuclease E